VDTQRDRGETLVELLVTLSIMGIAVVALVGGVAASIRMSDIHRRQATAGAFVREYAEALETSVAAHPSGYDLVCTGSTTYQSPAIFTPSDANYNAAVNGVLYWNGTTFVSACTPGSDPGVQRVSLQVSSTDGRAVEKLDVVLRRPCRPAIDGFSADPPCS
jgi:type II secretory pathway pseudopilin PulG